MSAKLAMGGYRPGALAQIVKLHMDYYAPVWGFGQAFEVKVAGELAAFLERRDPARDFFRCAYRDEALMASITIDGMDAAKEGAHLRWFIVSEAARGQGLGQVLMSEAMTFCRDRGYTLVYLTTFAGLDAARHLYETHGFRLESESAVDQWQGGVVEQRFEARL